MKYIKKAKILSKHFGLYGLGNFDLTSPEIAEVLRIIENEKELDKKLTELYNELSGRLAKII